MFCYPNELSYQKRWTIQWLRNMNKTSVPIGSIMTNQSPRLSDGSRFISVMCQDGFDWHRCWSNCAVNHNSAVLPKTIWKTKSSTGFNSGTCSWSICCNWKKWCEVVFCRVNINYLGFSDVALSDKWQIFNQLNLHGRAFAYMLQSFISTCTCFNIKDHIKMTC